MNLNTLVTNSYGQLITFYKHFRLLISSGVKTGPSQKEMRLPENLNVAENVCT